MKKLGRLLCLILVFAVFTASFAVAIQFSDVKKGQWYTEYVEMLSDMGIIHGMGDGTFQPDKTLTRGEFIKLLVASLAPDMVDESGQYDFWAIPYLDAALYLGMCLESRSQRSEAWLDAPLSRYEMAELLIRTNMLVMEEDVVIVDGIESVITDYSKVPGEYVNYVSQAYAKGLLTGYGDGSFQGSNTLRRCEAAAVIMRLLSPPSRTQTRFNTSEKAGTGTAVSTGGSGTGSGAVDTGGSTVEVTPGYVPVANRSTGEFNAAVFGSADVTWHASYSDAQARWTTVTVNIWRLASDGSKYADTESLTVNKSVAYEVECIFQMIFEGSEKFPIKTLHTVRQSTSRVSEHMWGVAIDINAYENYYCYKDGTAIVGYYWRPYSDPYSIVPGGDVVTAFESFGWGWGGDGRWSTTSDYMHFSVTGN